MQSIDTEKDIATLKEQIYLVEKEHARLTQGEWALLQMLEAAVEIIDTLDERTRAHRKQLSRLNGDNR